MKTSEEAFKGFLITCDKNREREAVKDAYNFLEEVDLSIYSTFKRFTAMSRKRIFLRN